MPNIYPQPSAPTSSPPSLGRTSQDWSEKGIGPNWQRKFFYWLIRLGGKQRGYHMSNILTFWYVLIHPSIRRRCRFYLDRRFPDRRGALRQFLDTYRLVRTFGATLVDPMVVQILGPGAFNVASPDHDRLLEISADKKGLVVIHAHMGSWQIAIPTLGKFPKRVSVVRIPDPNAPSLADSPATIDPRTGLQSAMQMADALMAGEIVVLAGDRTLGSEKSVAPAQLLGGRVFLPIAPYRLASATGAPVLVLTSPKISGNNFAMKLAKVIQVPPGLGRNPARYAPYAQMFADCIEEFVSEYPWQFYNFYDFWQDPHGRIQR
jgi:predicted LPLAT superfamily acyltransferase